MKILQAGQTDMGAKRTNNEDNYYVDSDLYLVADGVGGHSAGEVASKMAADIVSGYMRGKSPFVGKYDKSRSESSNRLASAIRLANKAVHEASQKNPSYKGMASTLAAALHKEGMLSIAHVGDSRVYLIRANSILQLTDDHSVVSEQVKEGLITKEQARKSSIKNIVTRALGPSEAVEVDIEELPVMGGDRVLICSDGLSDMVEDDDMLSVVQSYDEPAKACAKLIDMANENGGRDNITVVLVYFDETGLCDYIKKIFRFKRRSKNG